MAIPMLLDRPVGVGMATALIALVPVAPWLAHASWHAYRDLMGEAPGPEALTVSSRG